MCQNDTNKAIYMVLFYDVLLQCSRREFRPGTDYSVQHNNQYMQKMNLIDRQLNTGSKSLLMQWVMKHKYIIFLRFSLRNLRVNNGGFSAHTTTLSENCILPAEGAEVLT